MEYTRRNCAKCRQGIGYEAVLEHRATVWDELTFCESCSAQLRVLLDAYPGLRSEISLPSFDPPASSIPPKERRRFFGLFG